MDKKEWFEEWFDSKYYHLLYNNRDENEATIFINKLLGQLNLELNSKVLDMGCGKGRHAIQLYNRGYNVTGLDISKESIIAARKHENTRLNFFVHDMRNGFRIQYYDAIFSLFTSFGYFKRANEHLKVLQHNYNGLKNGGIFIIDFMNSKKVINNLVLNEIINKEHVNFEIERYIKDNYINKQISFVIDGTKKTFTESVYGFTLKELTTLLEKVGFIIEHIAGDYNMSEFKEKTSDRLIIIAKKQK